MIVKKKKEEAVNKVQDQSLLAISQAYFDRRQHHPSIIAE